MESISRISSILETARDLTLEAARDASYARKSTARPLPAAQLRKLLDSRHEREVLEGLRRVIAMTYRNQKSLPYFSSVIKNIASPSLEVKKLVYIYLIHHAEAEPDTALLSINTIQKSLSDSNPQVRALALRVMSSIRVPVISQIVSLGIKKGAGDMSPHVRRAAALAIPKCYRLDPNTLPQLQDHLKVLLGDKTYQVAGAAVMAFLEVCEDRIDLIHPHYHSLVRKLVDMDEWGQLATLRLMMVYARKCFPRRTRRVKKNAAASNKTTTKGFYDEDSEPSEPEDDSGTEFEDVVVLDPDLELLLKACAPLLQSRNSAVTVAVARCYLYLGTPTYLEMAIGPLISLLHAAQDIQYIALHNIVQICLAHPSPFVPYYTHFLVRSTDSPHVWRLKLELLTLIFPHSSPQLQSLILAELSHFARSGSGQDPILMREAVRAIGRCAQATLGVKSSDISNRCMRLLLSHVGSSDPELVAESLEVVRHLIQANPSAHAATVVKLAKHLDVATSGQARASIIWLVGEFAGVDPENNVAADVLRILAKGFADEEEAAKLQILLLAAKVYVHHLNLTHAKKKQAEAEGRQSPQPQQPTSTVLVPDDEGDDDGGFQDQALKEQAAEIKEQEAHPIAKLWQYILLLTRYDVSYDLRDRARMYKALLAVPTSTELASLLLLAPKPVPHIPSPSESRRNYTLGSATLIIGEESGIGGLKGYENLPDWVEEGHEPDPALRQQSTESKAEYDARREVPASEKLDSALSSDAGIGVSRKQNGIKEKTLDDWLAEDEEEETEEETEEEDDEDEDEEDEESEEEETEDDATDDSEDEKDESDRMLK